MGRSPGTGVERQAGLLELAELRADFTPQLFVQVAPGEIAKAAAHRILAEFAVLVDQPGNVPARQRRVPAQQGQVQSCSQAGILPRQANRLLERRFIHHQARGGQNAFPMRADHGFVDGGRPAEVIRVDHKTAAGAHGRTPKELLPDQDASRNPDDADREFNLRRAIIRRHGARNNAVPGA